MCRHPPLAACTADRPPAGRARAAARGGGRCPALPAGRGGPRAREPRCAAVQAKCPAVPRAMRARCLCMYGKVPPSPPPLAACTADPGLPAGRARPPAAADLALPAGRAPGSRGFGAGVFYTL